MLDQSLQSRNPADGIAAKYFLQDRLGQVQPTHLLAFHGKSLARRQEFPVPRVLDCHSVNASGGWRPRINQDRCRTGRDLDT